MKIEKCIKETGNQLSVELENENSSGGNLYKVAIDEKIIFIDRFDLDKIYAFIKNAMDFIDENYEQ